MCGLGPTTKDSRLFFSNQPNASRLIPLKSIGICLSTQYDGEVFMRQHPFSSEVALF